VQSGESVGFRKDDLISAFYCLKYLVEGKLEWEGIKDKEVMVKQKQIIDGVLLPGLEVVGKYAFALEAQEKIDSKILSLSLSTDGYNEDYYDYKFDWYNINNPKYLKHQIQIEALTLKANYEQKGDIEFNSVTYLKQHPHFVGIDKKIEIDPALAPK
jgi:hypothetical protein